MNLIIITENDKIDNYLYRINDNRFEHIKNILKSQIGDIVQIGLLNGLIGEGVILELTEKYTLIEARNFIEQKTNTLQIDIICALPRPQTLKKVLAISATMGVQHIYLIRSEKVEKSYFHSPLLREENYTKYLIEGLSQGKRTKLPSLSIHNRFKKFFSDEFHKNDSVCLVAHPEESTFISPKMLQQNKKIVIAIGPEGGWNEFELDFIGDVGFSKFKLSSSILRVESAVTSALSQIELIQGLLS